MKKRISIILLSLISVIMGAGVVGKTTLKEIKKQKGYAEKHLALYLMMNQWVRVKQENKSIADYLKENDYKEIAIYGMNYVGETLLSELKGSCIKVKYGIDKNGNSIYSDVDVISPDDKLPKVDAIIVTAITFFDEIVEDLDKKVDFPIISLEDLLNEV